MAPFWLLVGLPGSGKSTWAAQFVTANPGFRIVSTDAIRAELFGNEAIQGTWLAVWSVVQQRWRQGLVDMAGGQLEGLIYDATNTRRRQRRTVITVARSLGFSPIIIYWFDAPLNLCLWRNRRRSRRVPEEVIIRMARQLTGAPPAIGDGADRMLRVRIDKAGAVMDYLDAADHSTATAKPTALASPLISSPPQFSEPLRLGVMASGNGSNLAAIAEAIAAGTLHARIKVLIYNNPAAYVAQRAKQLNIPAILLDHRQYPSRETLDHAILDALHQHRVDWVIMAGWMRRVTSVLVNAFPQRMLNIHPSLLPSFPGVRAVDQALAAGVKIAGCTVHFVELEVDSGPIVMQAAVPVLPGDSVSSLQARIQAQEHQIYPVAIALAAAQTQKSVDAS